MYKIDQVTKMSHLKLKIMFPYLY